MSPDDFEGVHVKAISEQLWIRTANYYKPSCVSCIEKTIVNVMQNMPLNIFFLPFIYACHYHTDKQNKNVLNRLSAWGMFSIRSKNFVDHGLEVLIKKVFI